MRHQMRSSTLGRSPSHRAAMIRNLVRSLMLTESVVTTPARAKAARALAERLITLGQEGSLHSRRLAVGKLHDIPAVRKVFSDIAKRNPGRKGGHTRILRLDARRLGDAQRKVLFELVDKAAKKEEEAQPKEDKAAVKAK